MQTIAVIQSFPYHILIIVSYPIYLILQAIAAIPPSPYLIVLYLIDFDLVVLFLIMLYLTLFQLIACCR